VTTIAFRDGCMAADSQATCGSLKYRVTKLVRLPCGGVAGACGLWDESVRAFEWLKKPSGKPPKLKDTSLLVAYADGRLGLYEDKAWTFMPFVGPIAVGSGAQAAIAAMVHFNATPLEAVSAAATADPATSGPFTEMRVEPKVKRKK
jgi:hypothetical protein